GDHAEFLKYIWEEKDHDWNGIVYEAKLIWHYDHRYATFEGVSQNEIIAGQAKVIEEKDKNNFNLSITPRYYIPTQLKNSLFSKYSDYKRNWLLVWRDVTGSANERTCVATIIPKIAASRSLPVLGFDFKNNPSVLIANLNSLVLDYIVRQKIGGNHLT
ncbi:MAG: hypothetical protein ACK559_07275, partial [bacterium]